MTLKGWFEDENRGVSPVIGVILMVAITVILAAVIAAFVLDLGQSQSTSASAGVEFDESGDQVTVRVINEGNTDDIYITMANSASDTDYATSGGTLQDGTSSWSVGDSATANVVNIGTSDDYGTFSGDISSGDTINKITVIGVVDGDEQVIQTYENN